MTNDSIFETIKKMLGVCQDDDAFDTDILVAINSTFLTLRQLAVGPPNFTITGPAETWADFLGDRIDLQAAKSYIYLKVKMMFDPPSNSFTLDAMKQQVEEIGYRLNLQAEGGDVDES